MNNTTYCLRRFIVLAYVWTTNIHIVQINNLKRLIIAFIRLKNKNNNTIK